MPADWSKGKLYAIRSHTTASIYIGSTRQTLVQRMRCHRSSYKRWRAGHGGHVTSFEILKHPDAYIELLEAYPCESKDELNRREGQLIREMNCVNKHIAGRTSRMYYRDNADAIKARVRRYYQINCERIKQHKRERVACECGAIISRVNLATHRKSYKHTHQFITWA